MQDDSSPIEQNSECELIDQLAEEFTIELQSGLSPDIEDYALRFPDLADQIRDLFPTLKIIAKANSQATRDAELHGECNLPERTIIGDYQIVNKIGQGGMGVVYEAQQQSLGRRVALKLLPYSIAHNKKFVERFRREARAAAKLHHTNIVPVYEVGQDRDTLFYAMQFIEGHGLDEIQKQIASIKDDTSGKQIDTVSNLISSASGKSTNSTTGNNLFKTIARLGISISDALNYSHQRSMIHRDVKPSNLILDTAGVVWLTDFGLVKTLDSELTETGDFIGTARYMSPERFKGTCDERADIYGLGMTLYELVTGRIAYEANDRMHLMDQIVNQEPTKPRDIDRSIPLDLETIILKAMEKDPRKRYQKADEFTQDLVRFVDDQPIHARRASIVERTARWVRRNKAQASAFASLVLLSIVLVVASVLIWQQRSIAEANLRDAVKQQNRADRESEFAQREMEKARDAVERMLSAVGDVRLRNVPFMDDIRRQLLEDALEFNRQYLVESKDPAVLIEAARAHQRIARIYVLLERSNDAIGAYEESTAILQRMIDEGLAQVEAQKTCAEIWLELSALLVSKNSQRPANDLLVKAKQDYRQLTEADPNNAESWYGLARAHQISARNARISSDNETAEKELSETIKILELIRDRGEWETRYRFEYGRTFALFGDLYLAIGRLPDAIDAMKKAIEIVQNLVDEYPSDRTYQESLAGYLNVFGGYLIRNGQPLEAQKAFIQTIGIYQDLASKYPQIPDHQVNAAVTQNGLAVALAISGKPERALTEFQNAVESLEKVVNSFPSVNEYRYQLAHSIRRLAVHYLNINQPAKSIEPFEESFDLMAVLHANKPEVSRYAIDQAELAFLIAQTIERTESGNDEGLRWIDKAIEGAQQLSQRVSDETEIRHKLAKYIRMKASFLEANERYEDAIGELKMAIGIQRQLVESAPQFIEYPRHLAISLHQLGSLYVEIENLENAEESVQEALLLQHDNMTRNPNRPDHAIEALVSFNLLAEVQLKLDNPVEAETNLLASLELAEEMMSKHPEEFRFRDQFLITANQIIPLLHQSEQIDLCKQIFVSAKEAIEREANCNQPNPKVLALGKEISDRWESVFKD